MIAGVKTEINPYNSCCTKDEADCACRLIKNLKDQTDADLTKQMEQSIIHRHQMIVDQKLTNRLREKYVPLKMELIREMEQERENNHNYLEIDTRDNNLVELNDDTISVACKKQPEK